MCSRSCSRARYTARSDNGDASAVLPLASLELSRSRVSGVFGTGSKRLVVDLDARLRGIGTYNMAFTMWAVSGLPVGREHISHEIMIWNANHGQSPAGPRAGNIEVGGVFYDLYVEHGHGDASGASAQRWTYVAFISRTPVHKGQLDLGVTESCT